MGNKDMKSQPEQGRYRGAVPWAGLIFPAPSFLLHDYRELLIEHLRVETFVLKMKLQRKKTSDRVHARDLRQPTAFCSGAVGEWKGKCRLKAKWMGDVRDDEFSWTSSKMTDSVCVRHRVPWPALFGVEKENARYNTGDKFPMEIEHCVELWFGAYLFRSFRRHQQVKARTKTSIFQASTVVLFQFENIR